MSSMFIPLPEVDQACVSLAKNGPSPSFEYQHKILGKQPCEQLDGPGPWSLTCTPMTKDRVMGIYLNDLVLTGFKAVDNP